MNGNKAAVILNRIFHIVFFLCLGIVFVSIFIIGYTQKDKDYDIGTKISVMVSFLILTAAFTGIYLLANKSNNNPRIKQSGDFSDSSTRLIIFIGIAILFILQLFAGYLLEMNPVTDMNYINRYSLDFAKTGNFDLIQKDYANGSVYLIRYPNNFALVFLLSFVYRIAYLIFGYVPMFVPVILNVCAINVSVLFTVLTARKLFGNKKSLFVLLLCALFAPYYTYTPYYYTDSLSMPFVAIPVYLFVCALDSDKKIKKYVLMEVCGALLFIGFKLKGSIIIIVAVAVVYLVLKLKFKRMICFLLALVIGFGSVGAVYTVCFKSMNIVSEQQSDEYEYPMTHWIMMGLKGYGHYNLKDSQFTESFPTKQEKQEANIVEIKKRLKDYGADGFAKHILSKAVWTWQDGTYFISHHIEKPVRKNVLHDFVLDEGKHHWIFFAYSCGFQLFLILMMLISLIKGIIKPKIDIMVFLKGIVFAALLFFLIWETRSRYLFNFTPIFILLAVDGLDVVANRFLKSNTEK